jgi:uncharacterized protein
MKFDKIDAVLKVTERCNINCTYCYMFNKESELFRAKPKQMSLETAAAVARFLRQGAIDAEASVVRLILHGGEPMMMRPDQFDRMCQLFVDEIQGAADVQFSMQTNATLVSDEWVDLIGKYGMGLGISLDGDRRVNDTHRVDHQGRGTYDRSIRGARRLFEASRAGRVQSPAVLCVINPDEHGGDTLRHLVEDIGFKWIDFLLPIDTRDTLAADTGTRVGAYLAQVFEAWNAMGDRSVSIRFFDQFYTFMTGIDRPSNRAVGQSRGTQILTVASDGTYGPDDTLRIVSDDYFSFDCRETPLAAYLRDPRIAAIERANSQAPAECDSCAWSAYCLGGSTNGRVVNRYSPATGFESKSGLCEGLQDIYGRLARQLVGLGYPPDAMYQRLDRRVPAREAVAA